MHGAAAAMGRRINVLGICAATLLFGICIIYFRIRMVLINFEFAAKFRRWCGGGDSDGCDGYFCLFCGMKAPCSVFGGGGEGEGGGSGSVLYTFLHVGRCGEQRFESSVRLHALSGRTRPQSESAPYACDWRAPVVAKQSCSSCAK